MTAIELRSDLKTLLKDRFEADYNYGEKINFYEQHLPQGKKYDTDVGILYPFVLIEIDSGVNEEKLDENDSTCKVNFIVAVSLDNPEHPEALTLIERIEEVLRNKKYIGNKYEVTGAFDWAVATDGSRPFEYGHIDANFIMRKYSTQYEDDLL